MCVECFFNYKNCAHLDYANYFLKKKDAFCSCSTEGIRTLPISRCTNPATSEFIV